MGQKNPATTWIKGLMEDYKTGKPYGLYLILLAKAQGLFGLKLRLCFQLGSKACLDADMGFLIWGFGPVLSGPHLSPHKGSIRVSF